MLAEPAGGVKPPSGSDRRYVACGRHAVEAFLRARPDAVRELLVASPPGADLERLAAVAGIAPRSTAREELERIARGVRHQGIVALGQPPRPASLDEILERGPRLFVVCDGITDPRNVGAIFRSAEAAGAGALALARDRAPRLSPALVRAAAGAVEWLPHLRVVNVARLLDRLRAEGFWVIGLDAAAETSLFEPAAVPGAPLALVLGSEGRGIRPLVARSCHLRIGIPMAGRTESLNVSVAAAVALFEVGRRLPAGRPRLP